MVSRHLCDILCDVCDIRFKVELLSIRLHSLSGCSRYAQRHRAYRDPIASRAICYECAVVHEQHWGVALSSFVLCASRYVVIRSSGNSGGLCLCAISSISRSEHGGCICCWCDCVHCDCVTQTVWWNISRGISSTTVAMTSCKRSFLVLVWMVCLMSSARTT